MQDTSPTTEVGRPDPADNEKTARYIGRMAGELRVLATGANLGFLAYLLSMIEEEALTGAGRNP